jgi:uncharacterized membrane protein
MPIAGKSTTLVASNRLVGILSAMQLSQQEQLQEQILQNVDAILSLDDQKKQNIPKHQRVLDTIATAFGQPWFLYAQLLLFSSWSAASYLAGHHLVSWDIPRFSLREQGIDVAALIISTGVLIYETRQEEENNALTHLMLQLNLISEQKIAKLIALVEELRKDLPNVKNRLDLEAEAMQQITDPQVVLDIIQVSMKPTGEDEKS